VNAPPRIVDPEGPRGTEHVRTLFADPTRLPIIATDPDGDDLVFSWDVPGYTLQPITSANEGGLWSSSVDIPYDPDLDGVLVRVVVIDQSPEHNSQPVLFRLEVP
jgi:hypothetical protein